MKNAGELDWWDCVLATEREVLLKRERSAVRYGVNAVFNFG